MAVQDSTDGIGYWFALIVAIDQYRKQRGDLPCTVFGFETRPSAFKQPWKLREDAGRKTPAPPGAPRPRG